MNCGPAAAVKTPSPHTTFWSSPKKSYWGRNRPCARKERSPEGQRRLRPGEHTVGCLIKPGHPAPPVPGPRPNWRCKHARHNPVHRHGARRGETNERERLALAGFLAGYSGLTRDAYALDLASSWPGGPATAPTVRGAPSRHRGVGRDLEAKGRARSTVSRRLCTVAGFYRYAVEEELLEHSPAVHVRRPRVDDESHATALDRNEVGALLVAAGLGPAPSTPSFPCWH